MPDIKDQLLISLSTCQEMIRFFPCFSSLSSEQTTQLALSMQEIHYHHDEIIVNENDMVDSIYIIISGEAEVTRQQLTKRKKSINVPVAVLRVGEGIGLNDTGFYSTTGKRTATVKALTDMILLRLDIKDLYAFLKANNLELSMYAASLQMLRMRFIKQSLPFAQLSHERLQWLANHVKEQTIQKDSVLFRQGEEGDQCYLIRSGKIEIIHKEDDGHEKSLAILTPPTLFGEATLITRTPRNAKALAIEDSELLVLSHKDLSELLESEENVANMFMTLMVDRSRPLQNKCVTMHHRSTADGQELTILKNPNNGNYFKLSEQGSYIWHKLDGKHTLQEITLDFAEHYKIFSPDTVVALISKLEKAGLIEDLHDQDVAFTKQIPAWRKLIDMGIHLTNKRIAFGDADKWLTPIYSRYVKYFFTRPAYFIFILITILGFTSFCITTPKVLEFFSVKHVSLFLLLGLVPFSLVKVTLHELGHAFTVKFFGYEVHYMGIGMYGMTPIAFTDTSDMWLAKRKPRIMVNLAGVCTDLILAGLSGILLFWITNPYVAGMLWLFALYAYLGGFVHLNPTQEMDGYYVLMDCVEKNRLRHNSVLWLLKKFPKSIQKPRLFKENKPEIIYWLSCIAFLTSVTILTYTVQTFILKVIGMASHNLLLTLMLPFIATVFSSLGIIAEIRNTDD